jgi:hypothetical protein
MKKDKNDEGEIVAIKEFSDLIDFDSGIHELINNSKIIYASPHIAVLKAVNFIISEK